MNRRKEPLDAGERELADLLARESPPGPSPQLDARILAAARAATATPERAARRPRRRWIAGMAVAATLVLAVGVAWRLRPLPQRPVASEVPVAEVARPADSMPRPAVAPESTMPAPQAARDRIAVPLPPSPAVAPKPAPEPARKQAPPEPPMVVDEPAPMDAPAAAPAPPPPPPPAAAPEPAPDTRLIAVPAQGAQPGAKAAVRATNATPARAPAPEAFESARARQDAATLDRIETTGSRINAAEAADAAASGGMLPSRAELDEEPPATADSPLVQEAWLQRIRELLSAGDTEAARNSLDEFRRRYPHYALPADLRALGEP
jgi:hypothetical protein